MRIGLTYWNKIDHLGTTISSVLNKLGHDVIPFEASTCIPDQLDVILTYGPFGTLAPLGKQLTSYAEATRPAFVLWLTEQLTNPSIPEWIHVPISVARSRIEQISYHRENDDQWETNFLIKPLTSRANRFRYYGDIRWLHREGVLTVLAVGSDWIAKNLREHGFDPITAYIGSHPGWYANLKLERDIPVIWLGNLVTHRRKESLQQVRRDLQNRGVKLHVVDGVENPYIFGNERTKLLNRTKVIINLLRTEWDNHSLRFFLAIPNGCLVVSEPVFPHLPIVPGTHYVESPLDTMAEKIIYYLNNEQERKVIVDRAIQLITSELTMENSVRKILGNLHQNSRKNKWVKQIRSN